MTPLRGSRSGLAKRRAKREPSFWRTAAFSWTWLRYIGCPKAPSGLYRSRLSVISKGPVRVVMGAVSSLAGASVGLSRRLLHLAQHVGAGLGRQDLPTRGAGDALQHRPAAFAGN